MQKLRIVSSIDQEKLLKFDEIYGRIAIVMNFTYSCFLSE